LFIFSENYIAITLNKFIESPVNENISNSAILKPLSYNKKEDENIKINKDFRSDSLSRSQYNKVRYTLNSFKNIFNKYLKLIHCEYIICRRRCKIIKQIVAHLLLM